MRVLLGLQPLTTTAYPLRVLPAIGLVIKNDIRGHGNGFGQYLVKLSGHGEKRWEKGASLKAMGGMSNARCGSKIILSLQTSINAWLLISKLTGLMGYRISITVLPVANRSRNEGIILENESSNAALRQLPKRTQTT